MKKLLKRIFCKHKNKVYSRTFLDEFGDGSYITHHVWKCKDCGKEFF